MSYGAPLSTVRTTLAARESTGYTAGLNMSASEFLFPHGSAYRAHSNYESSVPSLIPMTNMSSVSLLPSSATRSLPMVSGPFPSSLPPVKPTSQSLNHYELSPMSFQVPPVMKYDGNSEAEPFEEWLEQFELVASVCHSEGRAKLVNLVTRLQGQTYAFYWTCPSHQRTSYEALTATLTERFNPVCIKSVQSGLFHEQKQQPKESVEEYAQDLNRLYQRA